MTTVIVGGAVANRPNNGGGVWVRLSWIQGLRKLGFHVVLLEQIERAACRDAAGDVVPFRESVNYAYFQNILHTFDLANAAALIYEGGEETLGLAYAEVLDLVDDAELLINISGHLTLEPLMQRLRRKVYIDIDPGFTQFWHATGIAGAHLAGHDDFFTIGENIGTSACSIPTHGITWRPTRQPVVLEDWPVATRPFDRFTTVANWRGPYGSVEYEGTTYGLKVHEFRKFITLPERAPYAFELALAIHPADERDLIALKTHGWRIVDPQDVAAEPLAFRDYVNASGAEFSVAQGVYVDTNSGWFSDRTVRYLAAGRPVLVQDTGFSRNLPTGEGLVAFQTINDAIAGAADIVGNYEHHCRAARHLAEEYFRSDRVLGRIIEELDICP